ncbi:MAG: MaoC family dehydratase N-terminal domain-containing protein [Bauldia sp.]
MNDTASTSADDFAPWIGRTEQVSGRVSERLVREFHATFAPHLADHDAGVLPLLAHWCLTPEAVEEAGLTADGHPQRGGFLPPITLPRRMWAGGEVTFHGDLRVGDEVTRTSTIRSIVRKAGRSGNLWLIDVSHGTANAVGPMIQETQTIVYREAGASTASPSVPTVAKESAARVEQVGTSTVRLFRYSAMTFNSHRIHYDFPYAREVESYPGLVVHGPLQATLLAHLAAKLAGQRLRTFRYRATSPLIAGDPAELRAARSAAGIDCCVCDAAGNMTMEARATWDRHDE